MALHFVTLRPIPGAASRARQEVCYRQFCARAEFCDATADHQNSGGAKIQSCSNAPATGAASRGAGPTALELRGPLVSPPIRVDARCRLLKNRITAKSDFADTSPRYFSWRVRTGSHAPPGGFSANSLALVRKFADGRSIPAECSKLFAAKSNFPARQWAKPSA